MRLDSTENRKRAWLFPIQVTVAEDHVNTEPMFFAHWARWNHQLTWSGFEVEAHFLWITPEKCHATRKFKERTRTSSRDETLVNPAYTSHRVPLSLVSQDISDRYQSAVEELPLKKGEKKASVVSPGKDPPEGYTPVLEEGPFLWLGALGLHDGKVSNYREWPRRVKE